MAPIIPGTPAIVSSMIIRLYVKSMSRENRWEHRPLVYTTPVNSAFRARWLASSELISEVLFTSEQPKKNKMASRFKYSYS